MQLRIRVKEGTDKDAELVRAATTYMMSKLLKPEQLESVSLHITLTSLEHDFGDIELHRSPKFIMRLHSAMDPVLMVTTVAHELIHVAQKLTGRLQLREVGGETVWCWGAKCFGADPYDDPSCILPWEDDAECREGDLALSFFRASIAKMNLT